MKITGQKKQIMLKAITTLVMVIGVLFSFSQDPIMRFEGKVSDASGKKLDGVSVKILRDGKEVHSTSTGGNGRYQPYEAYYGYIYKVIFTKDGLVSKTIEINSKDNFYEEDVEKEIAIPIDVSMINKEPAIDYSPIENKPVARFHIDKNTGLMDIDYPFVNDRKKEIEKFFEDLAKNEKDKEKRFKDLVKAGDKALKDDDFENAIKNWQEALKIQDDDEVRIKITDAQMIWDSKKEELEQKKKFDDLIKAGDDLVASNKFDEGIAKYQEAQNVLPKEKLPQDKIEEANKKKEGLAEEKLNKEYNDLMAQAKQFADNKDYPKAIETYTKAKGVKPKEREPDQKIKEINDIIEQAAKNKALYQAAITAADQLFNNKAYKEAKDKYEEALELIPNEKHPTDRIKEIQQILKDQEAAKEAEKEKQEQYKELIKKADDQLKSKDYTSAKDNYTKASALFPDETYPKGKLTEIENLIRQSEEEYNNSIKEGDKLLAEKKYEEAIKKYEAASNIKKSESYPKDQIKKANELLGEAKKNELDAKKKKEEFDNLVDEGNKLFRSKDYTKAKEKFQEASNLLPDEKYPKDQIKAIDDVLAGLDKEYNDLISAADGQLESGELEKAIETYEKALAVKTEQYPKDQIEKAKKLIADKKKAALNAKELEEKYNQLKAEGDRELTNQNFNLAKQKYQEALDLKPDAEEPKKQIAFIDDMMKKRKERYDKYISEADQLFQGEKFEVSIEKYEEALWILPVEQYPKDQIELARKRLENKKNDALAEAEKDKKYQELIEQGNLAFTNNNYKNAKDAYNGALNLKPNEQYPKDQLALIEAKLKELADKNAKEEAAADKEKRYKELVDKGDYQYQNEKYLEAKESYKKALEIKTEQYPQDQISKINEKLTELNQLEELKKQYKKIIEVADKNFANKEYQEAKDLYKRAMNFMPGEEYPVLKIAEIDKILADIELSKRLALEDEARRNILYQKLISSGDDNFKRKQYQIARDNFVEASNLKPSETYPKQKIEELDKILDEIAAERDKYKKLSEDYFKWDAEAYGEEVDINENEANLIITKTQDNREYNNYLKVRNYIDSHYTVSGKEIDRNINTTYLSYRDYERIKEKIMKENNAADITRQKAITSYDLFWEYYRAENKERVDNAYEQNSEIAEQITDLKEEIGENQAKGQASIEENAKEYEKLNDRFTEEKQEIQDENIDKTSEIYEETLKLKEKIGEEHKEGQASIERNASNYERLNNRFYDENKELQEDNIDKTSEIYEQITDLKEEIGENHTEGQLAIEENAKEYEELNDRFFEEKTDKNLEMLDFQSELAGDIDDLKERLIQEFADGQYSIELNAKEYEKLNDRFAEEQNEIQEANTDKTSEIYEQTLELKEEIAENHKEGQANIEENAENYEKLNNRFYDENKELQEENIDKTSEVFNQTTKLKDNIAKNQNDGQEKIEANAKLYENYNDKLAEQKSNQADNQYRAGQEVAEDLQELKEDIEAEQRAGNLAIEANAINYENLNNRFADESKYQSQKNTDDTYRNSKEYEYTKDNLDKKESDNVMNQLALIFPEGVTQKIYQRKNNEGEVVEITVKRVVVRGNKGNEYRKTTNKAGTYYFKNGQPISGSTWDIETSGEIVNSDE